MVACSIGNYPIVNQAIQRGSNLALVDCVSGRTALHYCSAVGNIDIFNLLIDSGMDPLCKTIGG
jgi:ankyrin repeat protein